MEPRRTDHGRKLFSGIPLINMADIHIVQGPNQQQVVSGVPVVGSPLQAGIRLMGSQGSPRPILNPEHVGRPVVQSRPAGDPVVRPGQATTVATSSNAAASLLRPVAVAQQTPQLLPRPLPSTPALSTVVNVPARKRLYSGSGENDEPPNKKKKVLAHKTKAIQSLKDTFNDIISEFYFLKTGGNIMDYHVFCKRPSLQFNEFTKTHKLDENEPVSELATSTPETKSSMPSQSSDARPSPLTRFAPVKVQAISSKQVQSVSSSSLTDSASSSQQSKMAEKAKQEAYIMQRISSLQKDGLWSEKRLPKQQEPPRAKAHWDYVLEEMIWLSADFAQERKWKKNAAKKCAKMVQKHFQDKQIQAQRAEKSEELRLKKIAAFIAKEVRNFWNDISRIVEHKNKALLEEKKRKALDQHLSFIVDQTEKYSSQLAKEMGRPELQEFNSVAGSLASDEHNPNSDVEFEPNASSDDDEETIARAEGQVEEKEQTEEVKLLEQESTLPLDDVINMLPPEVRDAIMQGKMATLDTDESKEDDDEQDGKDDDDDFESAQSSSDDEETIQEQEKEEEHVDHKKELKELEDDNNLTVEELRAKYASVPSSDTTESMEVEECVDSDDEDDNDEDMSESVETGDKSSADEDEEESDEEDDDEDEEVEEDEPEEEKGTDLKSLIDNSEMTDVDRLAHTAEEYQPKGYTLSSTKVETKVPFLLKHGLREYQHVGLEWLATMYNKNLNGILADEMGLGKTIQTIALLAHLACEKGTWGPHLIVVPTSVMLNWEMEFKKWCPAFKILTYYGSQKERKAKRTGWTRENAFHVCITSYKLVIQDHQSFRRKKWVYFILDEAQNIKNFKSQRWQLLLNFQSQRRLLLTGTPLQNNLMELWSLMHFLMPHVFESHKDFREWFSNPLTGMIEGNNEFNENVLKRLHKVLRPFLLRRLKSEVEKQMPKKYEHIVMCRLSKRQRYLYDDFMSRAKTRETLASGNLLSVINVLMQLRKVCNHPNLFEVRPIISPFQMEGIDLHIPSLVYHALDYNHIKDIDLAAVNLLRINFEYTTTAYVAHRVKRYATNKRTIEEIDQMPEPPPPTPQGKIKLNVRANPTVQPKPVSVTQSTNFMLKVMPGTSPVFKHVTVKTNGGQPVTIKLKTNSTGTPLPLQVFQSAEGGLKALQVAPMNVAGSAAVLKTVSRPATTYPQLVQTAEGKLFMTAQQPAGVSGAALAAGRPVLRVPPMQAKVTTPLVCKPKEAGAPVVRSPAQISLSAPRSLVTNMTDSVRIGFEAPKPKSQFYLDDIEKARKQMRKDKLNLLSRINAYHSESCPLFGEDLLDSCDMVHSFAKPTTMFSPFHWRQSTGMINCMKAQDDMLQNELWVVTNPLRDAIYSHGDRVKQLSDVISRFVLFVPAVNAPVPRVHASHGHPSKLRTEALREEALCHELVPRSKLLHPIINNMSTQFPDPRLIQYDCGKLQVLDKLLRELKSGGHRVLLFTQMTRMLDVLESFLNYHGYIYLRLDGTTKVDQRMVLMERFNNDKRIFAFILSTRSGGVGVNLTGADTVIFYDSDWNPTMDAQAQDRCHRIGQTRDVHIYRLVSEMTVEENILKKANQKRLLGDLAIEGGNFTTAYFKNSTIHELFNVNVSESSAARRMADVLEHTQQQPESMLKVYSSDENTQEDEMVTKDKTAVNNLESVLAAAEDESDVIAARTARAEVAAELEEFDENVNIEEKPETETLSKAEQEFQNLVVNLNPVERYALKWVEQSEASSAAEQLAATEAEMEQQKREWELQRLKAAEEQRLAEEAEQMTASQDLLTYSSRDARAQIWKSGEDVMPMWCPPTPPQEATDVYIDHNLDFLYESAPMPEEKLPSFHTKQSLKRARDYVPGIDRDRRPFNKLRRIDEVVSSAHAARSLFDRPSPALLKIRKEWKNQKLRGIGGASRFTSLAPLTANLLQQQRAALVAKPQMNVQPDNQPPWLIFEDWALLQTMQNMQEINPNIVINPGHTPNFDLMSDMVNTVSRNFRSQKQCRLRCETVIMPREEGRVQLEPSPKKLKKHKGLHKAQQPGRPLRTSQLFAQDSGASFTKDMTDRFDVILGIAAKRAPPVKPMHPAAVKNTKLPAILAEQGINFDQPLTPIEVILKRNEKINKVKHQQNNLAEHYRLQNQVQSGGQVAKLVSAQAASTSSSSSPASSVAAMAVSSPASSPATPPPNASTSNSGVAPVVVNISQHPTAASQTVTGVAATASAQASGGGATLQSVSQQIRSPRTTVALTVQSPGGNLVPVTQIPVQQAQRFTTASLVASHNAGKGGTLVSSKSLTQAQVNSLFRQQQLLQQQKKLQAAAAAAAAANAEAGGSATATRTATIASSSGGTATIVSQKAGAQGAAGTASLTALQLHQRTPIQYQKPTSIVAAGKGARTMSEADLNILLKRQMLHNQKPAAAGTTATSSGASSPAQIQASGSTSSPQLTPQTVQFKTAVAPTARAGATNPQQVRQMMIAQRKLPQGKVILQGNQKHISAVTMQQLQVLRPGGGNSPIVTHAVVTKNVGGSVQRVIPVGTTTGNPQLKQQTFQVVTAGGQQITGRSGNQVLTFQDASIRQPVSVTLSNRAGVSPAQTQALISQVTAALNNSPTIIRQGFIPGQGPVRITSPSLIQQQKQATATVTAAATQDNTTATASTSAAPSTASPAAQQQNPSTD
ncbi:Hypothetical predicted protein [Cloeon dipterum]|uniref:Helicase domino n=1 Tax=Cloeon dipterum TaxID=197152 RepID=A0A8S1CH58_9INSE|nr:Hypothetical predicted protein [Cloeon dipterum]